MVGSAIFGCAGQTLTDDERRFFKDADPWGFILFRRNCETADQTRALCAQLRDSVGRDAPILIDHEGGRVSRLSPHIVPKRPAMGDLGILAARAGEAVAIEAAHQIGEILARDSRLVGCTVNCAPMIDVRMPGADDIVGDRAFSEDVELVAKLGLAQAEGLLAGGCLPIIKHIPGHGRAMCDSHLALPRVDAPCATLEVVDFAPFRQLGHLPLAMTAHIVYEDIDPDHPATLSNKVIDEIIRKQIGFDGLLMTDDLSMKALEGSFTERAANSLKAGCDLVLHCNGEMGEMVAVAEGISPLSVEATRRSEAALQQLRAPTVTDISQLEERFASQMNRASLA